MRKQTAPRRRQRGMSLVLMIGLIVALLLVTGGAGVTALYLTGVVGGDPAAAAEGEQQAAQNKEPEPLAPAIYLPLEPALIANFDKRGNVGFLQVSVELMARDQSVVEAARKHMAVIRNNLLFLLSGKSYEELADRAGKEALRQQALDEINKILAKRNVDGRVEAVYFTAFVMQ